MSSHKLQSALMLTVEFSRKYIILRLVQGAEKNIRTEEG
jgi:hypothetical protein